MLLAMGFDIFVLKFAIECQCQNFCIDHTFAVGSSVGFLKALSPMSSRARLQGPSKL